MLVSLKVQNYALIEHLEINFSNSFSTITGETGAGKSIILGALGLVLGQRADLNALKDNEKKCVVEAVFLIDKYNLKSLFENLDIDFDIQTIIRREILPSGKSRAFVNDTPINISDLQEIADYLLDIHSQQDTRALETNDFQMFVIDAIASNSSLLNNYSNSLKLYKKLKKELEQLELEKNTLGKEHEYNLFLYNELLLAQLKADEIKILEEELEKLSHVEQINESLLKILQVSHDEGIGVIAQLNECRAAMQKINSYSVEFQEIFQRINSVTIEFEDVLEQIYSINENTTNDPERLEWVSNRLKIIFDLFKKHQVTTIEELLTIQEELKVKTEKIANFDEELNNLKSLLDAKIIDLDKIASAIHDNRKTAIPIFENKMHLLLKELGMPNAKFRIDVESKETYFSNGKDELQFMFSANQGMNFGLLKKVASGGEMSRIMLAIKSVLAEFTNLPSIIFDEIDTGVSGEIALKMAEIMKDMSKNRQVFAITHLPQIASKGLQHFKVFKFDENGSTITQIKLLNQVEREKEIAEMLSGKDFGETALQHARVLLN